MELLKAMDIHAHSRPKLTITVRAFEAHGNRQLFAATRNPSVRCPPHLQVDANICLTRRRTSLYGEQNCQTRQHMEANAVASLVWMYSRHGRLEGLNVKNLETGPNVRTARFALRKKNFDLLQIRRCVIGGRHRHIKHNSCCSSVPKIHNAHKETANELMR